jgi:pyruvate,water dikinase
MLINILLEMAKHPPAQAQTPVVDTATLQERYLKAFKKGEQRDQAREILDLGRVSYQLRDDDNIYLGRIEDQLQRVVNVGRKRLAEKGIQNVDNLLPEDVIRALNNPTYIPQAHSPEESQEEPEDFRLKGRQLIGQPAGPGLVKATARVILNTSDLSTFTSGDILVCDAVDPTMTFVVPLAAGIVERRGGMLIHGAIIAREYGLPCVTGVPDVTRLIQTGDPVTVDGYLGIVTLG